MAVAGVDKMSLEAMRLDIRKAYLGCEPLRVRDLIDRAGLSEEQRQAISAHGAKLVENVRANSDPSMMESFLGEYGLSTGEGVALMCLAEALLRVPDSLTMDDLIADKIAPHDWSNHFGGSSSIMVNASTWALMLTGRVLDEEKVGIEGTLRSLVRRLGEPVIRSAVGVAMREMGDQFVLGRTIDEAVKRGKSYAQKGYSYSYDMLGEAARTFDDAQRYFDSYSNAIASIAKHSKHDDIRDNPGISVKLSALHPRYEVLNRASCVPVLVDRLVRLARAAKNANMGLNIDAEEADRLDISLDIIEQALATPDLAGWDGFGVVVQAYGLRAPFVLNWLYGLAQKLDRKIMVRLVKGAYWDSEIKRAQILGIDGFPVFTSKAHSDISYLGCARQLLGMRDRIYPQFATHNAHSSAAILAMAQNRDGFEFQRLHGMGEALHEEIVRQEGTRCRIYAPVGEHGDLLAYLVRRLLENGANSSFVHKIVDETVCAHDIAADPIALALDHEFKRPASIVSPVELFAPERINSKGFDVADELQQDASMQNRAAFDAPHQWHCSPLLGSNGRGTSEIVRQSHAIINPAKLDDHVGNWLESDERDVNDAVSNAQRAQGAWMQLGAVERGRILNKIGDLFEENSAQIFALLCREAGKSIHDAISELREAVDFLRYYGARACQLDAGLQPRGVIGCISPWNFPLAIFTGQIAAALSAGNCVIAKPAEQTPLIAALGVSLMREGGVPHDVIQLLPGFGESVGAALCAHDDIDGICFTGSTLVARIIERQLAQKAKGDAMLIAETGGLNAMIVDSTALPEQAVRDIVASAFQSAGQRCSALRMVYVQRDVYDKILTMLKGAMDALSVGDPWHVSNDIGPLIDSEAQEKIAHYCQHYSDKGAVLKTLIAPTEGRFCAPTLIRVNGIEELKEEIFGPVLHIATFEADEIDDVVRAINGTGYGLTFGLHTRIDARVQAVVDNIYAGNIYVNRNQIGAVVGSQPFGGEGLSGTGPKAGGPLYLQRFCRSGTLPTKSYVADAPIVSKSDIIQAFDALDGDKNALSWSKQGDRIDVLRKILRGRAAPAMALSAALDHGPVDLPGPTGESNIWHMVPRGTILCLGYDDDALLAQVVQALAGGNRVIAVAPNGEKSLQCFKNQPVPLVVLNGVISVDDWSDIHINCVALHGDIDSICTLRGALSQQNGEIVPIISDLYAPHSYMAERAACIDTTAAGGNASLLAAVE